MPRVKLDKEDVDAIKALCAFTTLYDREIAEMFGVCRKHINAIKNGKRWNYNYGEETEKSHKEAIERHFEKLRGRFFRK